MSSGTVLYFAQFPKNFDKLRAVLVAVNAGHHVGGPRQFYREIIFTEPDLLIAPESEENVVSEKAVIIAENHMFESGILHGTLQKFSLEQKAVIPVTRSLFLYCLEFVLTHRLAPLWNKIDKYFIQGRDFLAEENKMCAIQADFSLTDKITLAMKAQLVKLPKPKVEDFAVSPNILQKFHESQDFSIHGYSLENNKCLVLPSLKTGYITCISHRDLEGIDFKRYWKVMYGFRLPAIAPERVVFYSIRFPMSGKIFSYPEHCIRHKEPQVSVRCDQKVIFKSFLEDLTLRMPSVCGSPLTFTSSILYPTNSLHLASLSKQTNLTRAPVHSKANQSFAFTKKNVTGISDTPNKTSKINSNTPNKVSNTMGNPCLGNVAVSSLNIHGSQSQYPTVIPNGIPSQNIAQASLDKVSKVSGNPSQSSNAISNSSIYGPRSEIPRVASNEIDSQNIGPAGVDMSLKAPIMKAYVPCFTTHKPVKELSKKMMLSKVVEPRKEKPLVPCFKKIVSKSKASMSNLKMVKLGSSSIAKVVGYDASKVDRPSQGNKGMVVSRDRMSLSLNKKDVVGGVDTINGSSQHTEKSAASNTLNGTPQFPEQRETVNTLNGPSQTELQKKKNTKEPKPAVIVDVRKMVAENKLSKVSAVAITKWLKSEGVKCKCKEKKQELMFKVYQYLGCKLSEP